MYVQRRLHHKAGCNAHVLFKHISTLTRRRARTQGHEFAGTLYQLAAFQAQPQLAEKPAFAVSQTAHPLILLREL